MKRPERVIFYPREKTIDDNGNLWLKIPAWLVRGYRLKRTLLMGRVKAEIQGTNKSMREQMREEKGLSKYFRTNWQKKLVKEKQGFRSQMHRLLNKKTKKNGGVARGNTNNVGSNPTPSTTKEGETKKERKP